MIVGHAKGSRRMIERTGLNERTAILVEMIRMLGRGELASDEGDRRANVESF